MYKTKKLLKWNENRIRDVWKQDVRRKLQFIKGIAQGNLFPQYKKSYRWWIISKEIDNMLRG